MRHGWSPLPLYPIRWRFLAYERGMANNTCTKATSLRTRGYVGTWQCVVLASRGRKHRSLWHQGRRLEAMNRRSRWTLAVYTARTALRFGAAS